MSEWLSGAAHIDRNALFSLTDTVTFGPVEVGGELQHIVTDPIVGKGGGPRLWLVAALPQGADVERERLGYAGIRAGLERLVAGLDASDELFIVTDEAGRIGLINNEARRLLGTSANAVAGKSIDALFRRSSNLAASLHAAFEGAPEIRGQWAEMGGRGRKTAIRGLTAAIIRDHSGNPVGALWMGRMLASGAKTTTETTTSLAMAESFVKEFFPEPERISTFKKGHTLFRPDEPVELMHIVLDGQVRLYIEGGERPRTIDYAYSGLIGVWDSHSPAPRHRYGAEVTKAATVCLIPRYELQGFTDPVLAERLLDLVREQQSRLLNRVDILLQTNHKRRLAKLLTSYADGARCDDIGLMLPRVSQIDLAEQIGATRKTVSDCLKEFQRAQLIRFGDRTIWVRDLQGLKSV